MRDYISREAAVHVCEYSFWPENVKRRIKELPAADVVEKEKYDRLLENSLIVSAALQEYQKADVVEVRHGRWLWYEDCSNSGLYCSACHKLIHKVMTPKKKLSNYCPNCGAKMDGGVIDGAD